jgi:PAS domain S-box-containing protein
MNNVPADQEYLKSLTLLYVEDENTTREMGSEFLSRLVGVLITAKNGAEGLSAYIEHNPDIVITDIQMPVMDGLTMIQKIRDLDKSRLVPVFVMSAFEQVDYLKRSIPLGAFDYVTKPLEPDKFTASLLACAHHLLEEKTLHQAQDKAELSRNMYAELFDFAPVAYFVFDTLGMIREANLSGSHLLGIERHLLAGKPFSSFVANEEGKEVIAHHLESVVRREGMQKCDIRLSGSDSTEIFGQLQSVLVGSEKSENMYILSSVVDGTASEKLKKEIQGALEYAENIVETVREPLVVLNSDLKILTANHSFYDTFKVTPEETIGNFIYDVGNRQWDIPALRILFEEILPNETVFNGYEVEHDFPDIGRKTILLNARQIFRENIGSRIILLAMEDITERKQLEVEIQNALEYAENIVETVREPMVVLDSELKILTANSSFYNIFKVTPDETIGNFIYDLGNRQWDIPKLRVLVEEILPLETVINGYEVEHDFPGIGRKTILLNARQIFRQKIGSHIILLAMEDITERKQIEAVLSENQKQLQSFNDQLENRIAKEVGKNREKDILLLHQDKMSSIGQLAAGVAHEINNPMAFIASNLVTLKGYVESLSRYHELIHDLLVKNGSADELLVLEEATKKLDIMFILDDITPLIKESSDGADRVKQIVHDLKGFARADDSSFELADLNDCVRSTVNIVRNEIKYVADLDLQLGEIPHISCSRNQLSQVIINLLVNAAHSIESHGSITVITRQAVDTVVLSVQDTGRGMSEEVRNRIFEPFYTTKEVGKGTGLGLSISYSIIKKHGGEIVVESEPGRGTIFSVILPIHNHQEGPA